MEPLQVDVVHFYPEGNAQPHHTAKFEVVNAEYPTTAIVRRGQPFSAVVRFTRPFDEENDIVQLLFSLGDKPQPGKGTLASIYLKRDAIPHKESWSARITDVQNDSVIFEVSTPVTVPVGSWVVRVITRRKDSDLRGIFDHDNELYILFNPWNPDDQTYMEETDLLQEYVLNDVGKLWVGPIKTARGRPWLFGQFDEVVLPACMFMLDRAQIPFHSRDDPVKVTRAISRIVNSNDEDGGVLVGRWDGEYQDGTAPTEWTGSADILREYLETQQEVPYGQCWVFSGVVTTVCRALGIPSRPVTNIVSAHDANGSLSVDKYYTEDMDEMEFDPEGRKDTIWNYHVWNEVWMARPDLPAGFGGWQAIDATPQETSSGLFQCGPAPLEAIKQAVLGLNHDVGFMVATVNADLMRWRKNADSDTYSVVDTNNYHIGRQILTKKPYVFDPLGDEDREEITHLYKYSEGTVSERMALMNGIRQSSTAKRYYEEIGNLKSDVSFKLLEIDTVSIGKEFRIAVDIDNNSNENRNIKAVLTATSVFYNGVKSEVVKRVEGKVFVGPGKHEQVSIQVTPEEYLPKLVEYGNLKISVMTIVDETKQSWADDDDFQVLKPIISVKFNSDLIIGQPTTTVLSFMNPLDVPLTECEMRVTSSGILGKTLRMPLEDVPANGLITGELPVQPNKIGVINVVATFKSKELKDISGAGSAEVFEG